MKCLEKPREKQKEGDYGSEPIAGEPVRRATLGDLVTRSASRFGNRTALVSGRERIDFKTLNEKSCRAAKAFSKWG